MRRYVGGDDRTQDEPSDEGRPDVSPPFHRFSLSHTSPEESRNAPPPTEPNRGLAYAGNELEGQRQCRARTISSANDIGAGLYDTHKRLGQADDPTACLIIGPPENARPAHRDCPGRVGEADGIVLGIDVGGAVTRLGRLSNGVSLGPSPCPRVHEALTHLTLCLWPSGSLHRTCRGSWSSAVDDRSEPPAGGLGKKLCGRRASPGLRLSPTPTDARSNREATPFQDWRVPRHQTRATCTISYAPADAGAR